MLEMKDELLYDFEINLPRILVTDKLVIVDDVSRLIDFTDQTVVTLSGKHLFTVVSGEKLLIASFQHNRLVCSGKILKIEFIYGKQKTEGLKNEG